MKLDSKGLELKGLWFNPNIHPEEEYAMRLSTLKQLQGLWSLDIDYMDRYGLTEFLGALDGHEGIRCEACYRMRLDETASRAKAEGFDAFSTTLLVSPYQKHDLLQDVGRDIQEKHGVEFYYEDFRPTYREGVKISRELGLYRQRYCGCLYSEEEREREKARSSAGRAHKAR